VRSGVPGVSGIFAELDTEDGFEFGDFLVVLQFVGGHAEVGIIVGVHVGGGLVDGDVFDLNVGPADAGERHPIVVTLV